MLSTVPLVEPPYGHTRQRWAASAIETLAAFARHIDERHVARIVGVTCDHARRSLGGPDGVRVATEEYDLTTNGVEIV